MFLQGSFNTGKIVKFQELRLFWQILLAKIPNNAMQFIHHTILHLRLQLTAGTGKRENECFSIQGKVRELKNFTKELGNFE